MSKHCQYIFIAAVDEVEYGLTVVLWDVLGFTNMTRVHLSRIFLIRLIGVLIFTSNGFLLPSLGFVVPLVFFNFSRAAGVIREFLIL